MIKENYTNLKETYVNGKTSGRINFYSHYKNNENTIDDPIFTGFTFDIDTLHSPLFCTDYETDITLRGGNGTDLATSIENHLNEVYRNSIYGAPHSYELNTLSTKDSLDRGTHNVGYGKQDKFYLDNVIYSATDYIYMVDKVSTSGYSDDTGFTDVGDGSPDSSVYDTYSNTIAATEKETDVVIDDNYDDDGDLLFNDEDVVAETSTVDPDINTYPLSKQIENVENELETNTEAINQHNSNTEAKNTAESNYNTVYDEYKDLKKQLDNLENNIKNQQTNIKSELSKYQSNAETELTRLKNNPSSGNSVISEITKTYTDYTTFYNKVSGNNSEEFSTLDIEIKCKSKEFNKENLSENVQEKFDSLKSYFNYIAEIQNTQIISYSVNTSTQNTINDLKKQIKAKESLLYGEDKTEANPDSDSLYGKLQSAKNTLNNDTYSQLEQKKSSLEQAKEHYYDTQAYNEYKSQKTTTSKLISLPTMNEKGENETTEDYNKRLDGYIQEVQKIRNSRITYEVPQTVYDMLGFIDGMKKMTTEYPYVMQTITGLDEVYKKYFAVKDPFMGSRDDKITITCYESLDLRVSSMFNKYFNAVYDHQYRRERIPVNLRRFQCSVFVHDIRNFRHALQYYNGDTYRFNEKRDGDDVEAKIVEIALNYVSAIEFKFYDCEIVPEETGTLFDNVSNESGGEMKKTNFTFTYGNCVINFLPFADLKKYYQPKSGDEVSNNEVYYGGSVKRDLSETKNSDSGDGNFRRWFDKSVLGNVNNNDYRDYVKRDAYTEVDDIYKTSIVNNFALNSVTNKQYQMTEMDDALRKIVVGISASTGIPVKGVTDALNIGNIYNYINKGDGSDMPKVTNLGNVTNSSVVDEKTMNYKGEIIDDNKPKESEIITDLENIYDETVNVKGTVIGFEDNTANTKEQNPIDLVVDLGKI